MDTAPPGNLAVAAKIGLDDPGLIVHSATRFHNVCIMGVRGSCDSERIRLVVFVDVSKQLARCVAFLGVFEVGNIVCTDADLRSAILIKLAVLDMDVTQHGPKDSRGANPFFVPRGR